MRPEKLAIVLLTVVVMAEGVKTSNIGYPCSPASTSPKVQADSNTDVSPSITEDDETTSRLTSINGDTPRSSSQRDAQRDITTDMSPSTSETIENAPRCNSLIVAGKNYDMAKIACGEIGGKMFGYEHVQSQKTAEETFMDVMSTNEESSSCHFVWVDIIRKDVNQFEWSGGPDFVDSDSWWGDDQPYDFGDSEDCVAVQPNDNWKLHDIRCTKNVCTMCMDAWCNSV